MDLVGKVGFVNDTVTYFSLFAMMGIATVGIREIAACGEDREKRSRVFSSLMAIVGILTFGVTLVYLGSLFVVNRFQADRNLFVIGTGTLLFRPMQRAAGWWKAAGVCSSISIPMGISRTT